MSTLSSSRKTPKGNSTSEALFKSKYQPTKDINPLASSRRKSPERLASPTSHLDFFSKSKELLVSSQKNFLSPKLTRSKLESSELSNPLRASALLKSSLSTTNRNRVKFEIGGGQPSNREPETNTRESLASPGRQLEARNSPSRASALSSVRASQGQSRRNFEELALRMQNLEAKMTSDARPQSPSFSTLKSRSPRNKSQFPEEPLKTETSIASERNDDFSQRKSRLKVFGGDESVRRTETLLNTQETLERTTGRSSKTYADDFQERSRIRIRELETKCREQQREFEQYKTESALKISELKNELQRMESRHDEELRKTQRELNFDNNKRLQESEFEVKTLKGKNRDLEEQIATLNRKIDSLQRDLKASEASYRELGNEHQTFATRTEKEVGQLQEQNNARIQQLTEKYEVERKRLKDSYEKLVNELSQENKQTYKNLNDEILRRDRRVKEIENERDEIQRNLYGKLDNSSSEIQILHETNRSQKRALEECREDILRLNSQLDDKKREIHILETQIEFLRTEKSKNDRDLLGSGRSPRRQLSSSGTTKKHLKGFLSPQ